MRAAHTVFLALAVCALLSPCANAQLVADGKTNVLNGVATNVTGAITIGTNGSFTLLVLSNATHLTNSGHGVIGRNAGANSNAVVLTGANTRWETPSQTIFVSSNGALSRLIITNGAQLVSGGGVIGNTLGASSNQVVIAGAGSMWTNVADILIGSSGTANTLIITNGGALFNSDGSVGVAVTSSNNIIWVADSGSSWNNRGDLFMGQSGARNLVVISNNATFTVGLTLTMGAAAGSTNNRVIVDGGTLRATNAAGTGLLNISRGTNILNAGTIETDQLRATNALGAFEFNGGLLVTRRATISPPLPFQFTLGKSGFGPATWDVRAGTTTNSIIGDLFIGNDSPFNQLLITNGASLFTGGNGLIGVRSASSSNSVMISGAGSSWIMGTDMALGTTGAVNHLVISNGAILTSESASIGRAASSSNNEALVTGSGSVWSNLSLSVGILGPANRLTITNSGKVIVGSGGVTIGQLSNSLNNRLIIDGGALIVTNSSHTAVLDVRRGTNVVNAAGIVVDRLLLTNVLGFLEFNGGIVETRNTTNDNGRVFNVGETVGGVLELTGGGTHSFANGLNILSNSELTGDGTIIGPVTFQSGSFLFPGLPIGKLVFNSPLVLPGQTTVQISQSGGTLTNDQVQVVGTITYAGNLTVNKIGGFMLNAGDRFQFFNATGYSGSFLSVSLPTLTQGLAWTNKLAVDGSIQVVATSVPHFNNVQLSGTNVVISGTNGPVNTSYRVLISTNLATPLTNWTPILTNHFDSSGDFVFSNGVSPAIPIVPRRFYVLQVP